MVEWTIDFPPNLSKLKLGTNNRLLLVECCMSGWLKLILNFIKNLKIILIKAIFNEDTTFNISNISKLQNITLFK